MTHNSVRAAALWSLYSSTVYMLTVIEDVLKYKNRVITVGIYYFTTTAFKYKDNKVNVFTFI